MRVLVVDDSTLYRKVVRDALASDPDIEVVGIAANGRLALEKIEQLQPDVVTLDVEMPEIDGLEVLRQLKGRHRAPAVLMLSALTSSGAALTTRALRLGAFDFILKPQEPTLEANRERLRTELVPKLRLLAEVRQTVSTSAALLQPGSGENMLSPISPRKSAPPGSQKTRPQIVAIGVSTGGPAALAELLPKLPFIFPVPIVIVQHMPPMFTRSLAEDLDRICALQVYEAADGQPLLPGTVCIAPGGRQMGVTLGPAGPQITVTDDPPEKSCKPSVDYLFRSLANLYGSHVLAVVMTGMGDDGMLGCKTLKRCGATIVVQDESSSVVYGMPRCVVECGVADAVCHLSHLPETILQSVHLELARCS